ncbi:MAG: hypothetical protein SFX19_03835 [Alphaproteobacteria bacterium]|nr:hypothetical protein [Alphaproteobacteria bacterium]
MSDGSNNNWVKKSWTKSSQMLIADMVGNATEIIFLRYQEPFDKAFPFLKSAFKTAMYTPVKMLQKPIEWAIDNLAGSIEGEEGRELRHHQTEEQRLDGLLNSGYHYSAALAVGWGSLVLAEKGLSRATGTKELPGRMWTRLDLPVHLGTAWFLGTSAMQPVTGSIKDTTKNIMKAAGWSEEKAEQDSRFAIAYILPNYLTLIPTAGMMAGLYKAESKGVLIDKGQKSLFGTPEHHFEFTGKKAAPGELGGMTEGMLKIAKGLGIIHDPAAAKAVAH